jgi:hypothetical protein
VFTSNSIVGHLVPEKIRGDFKYTGTVTFGGTFRSATGEVEPISYFARTFPRTPTTTARGELCEEFTFAFGGIRVKPVYETKTREHRGITVDLGEGRQRSFRFPLRGVTVPPKEMLDFEIEFVADRSMSFSATCQCAYRFGSTRNAQPAQVGDVVRGNVLVPRTIDLDLSYRGTQLFMNQLYSRDSQCRDRARAILSQCLEESPALRNREISNVHREWQIADAVVVAESSSDRELTELAARTLRKLKGTNTTEAPIQLHNSMFEILAHSDPITAVDVAAQEIMHSGKVETLSRVIYDDRARPYLETYRPEVRARLLATPPPWPRNYFILAGCLRLDECLPHLISEAESDSAFGVAPLNVADLIWIGSQFQDGRFDAAVARHIRIDGAKPPVIAEIIAALAFSQNPRFTAEINELLNAVREKDNWESPILEALHYYEYVARPFDPNTIRVLKTLKDYPYSTVVQERSARLLGAQADR